MSFILAGSAINLLILLVFAFCCDDNFDDEFRKLHIDEQMRILLVLLILYVGSWGMTLPLLVIIDQAVTREYNEYKEQWKRQEQLAQWSVGMPVTHKGSLLTGTITSVDVDRYEVRVRWSSGVHFTYDIPTDIIKPVKINHFYRRISLP